MNEANYECTILLFSYEFFRLDKLIETQNKLVVA